MNWFFSLVLVFLIAFNWNAALSTPGITSPSAGEALSGIVNIQGTSAGTGFSSYEVTFSYGDGSASNWFLILKSSSPVENSTLASWDTQTISDGKYSLKLTIFLTDGKTIESIVPDLRVRNYSVVETSTPPPQQLLTMTPAIERATATLRVTPTLLPANPAEITTRSLALTLLAGGIGATASILVIGLYTARKNHKKDVLR